MPWLVATALLHSAIVVEKRATLKSWTVLLAIVAFSLSLVGTFIVRSGIITSVHAFANDPERGVFILAMLGVAIGGSLALYTWRAPSLRSDGVFAPISRESALVLNNLLMSVAAAVVFLGTLYPLFIELLTGGETKLSVGAPFFDWAFAPLMVLVLLVMPVGAALPWKRGDLPKAMMRLWPGVALAFAAGMVFAMLRWGGPVIAPFAVALAFWAVFGVLVDLAERVKLGRASAGESLRRLVNLPRAAWGQAVAHIGVGLCAFGVVAVTAWESEKILVAEKGDVIPLAGYDIRFDGVDRLRGPNYRTDLGMFTILRDGQLVDTLTSEKRFYPVQRSQTTEAGIRASLIEDVYVTLGERQEAGGWAVRMYVKPYANWIWLGALVMTLGGLLSLSDRRHRVGAPARRAKTVAAE